MPLVALGYFCAVLALAAASDLRTFRIPNWMPLALAAGAVVLAFPHSWGDAGSRGASFAIVVVATLALWLVRGLGGGDMKLLSTAALWMPLSTLPSFALAFSIAGGLQAAAIMVLRRRKPGEPRQRVPYAVAIAVGGFAWAWLSATA